MSEQKNAQTIIGPDCRITGEMQIDGDGVIQGQFDGTVRAAGVIELADSSTVSGTVVAGALRLGGRADADIVAEHGVELLAGSELSGRLYTNRLSIVDGASFEGEVVVGPKAMNAAEQVLHHREPVREPWTDSEPPRRRTRPSEHAVETKPESLDHVLHPRRSRVATADRPGDNGS